MIELHETFKECGVLFYTYPRENNQEGLVVNDVAFIILGILGKKFVSILDLKRLNTFIDLMEFLKKKGHG